MIFILSNRKKQTNCNTDRSLVQLVLYRNITILWWVIAYAKVPNSMYIKNIELNSDTPEGVTVSVNETIWLVSSH